MFICLILLVSFVYQQHQSRTGYSPPYHTWSEALKVLSRFCSASSVPGGNGYFKHWSWANGKGILIQVWNMWQGCCVLYATESNRNNYWKQTHLQLKLRESNWEVGSTKMLTSQDTTYLFSGIPRNSKPMPSVLAWKRISLAEKYGPFSLAMELQVVSVYHIWGCLQVDPLWESAMPGIRTWESKHLTKKHQEKGHIFLSCTSKSNGSNILSWGFSASTSSNF